MMEEFFAALLQSIEDHVVSAEHRKQIFGDIIPAIEQLDHDLLEELASENDAFAKAYADYLGETTEGEDY